MEKEQPKQEQEIRCILLVFGASGSGLTDLVEALEGEGLDVSLGRDAVSHDYDVIVVAHPEPEGIIAQRTAVYEPPIPLPELEGNLSRFLKRPLTDEDKHMIAQQLEAIPKWKAKGAQTFTSIVDLVEYARELIGDGR